MAGKKISELTAKTPASNDVLAVADPSTGIAGKSTCVQVFAVGLPTGYSSASVNSSTITFDSLSGTGLAKSTLNDVLCRGLEYYGVWQTNGRIAYLPVTRSISTNTNNMDIGLAGLLKLNCTAASDLTGITTSGEITNTNPGLSYAGTSAQIDGQVLHILNIGANTVSLKHESVSSTAQNRFFMHNGSQLNLGAGHLVKAIYDTSISRWRVWDLT